MEEKMNKAILIGRLTKDIDLRYTPDGQTAIGRFNLACPRGKDKNGADKGADFISCVAFGKKAETLERYVKKGHRIEITGQIRTGSYDKDGVTIYTTDVIVQEFEFLEPKAKSEPPEGISDQYTPMTYDDIPY